MIQVSHKSGKSKTYHYAVIQSVSSCKNRCIIFQCDPACVIVCPFADSGFENVTITPLTETMCP